MGNSLNDIYNSIIQNDDIEHVEKMINNCVINNKLDVRYEIEINNYYNRYTLFDAICMTNPKIKYIRLLHKYKFEITFNSLCNVILYIIKSYVKNNNYKVNLESLYYVYSNMNINQKTKINKYQQKLLYDLCDPENKYNDLGFNILCNLMTMFYGMCNIEINFLYEIRYCIYIAIIENSKNYSLMEKFKNFISIHGGFFGNKKIKVNSIQLSIDLNYSEHSIELLVLLIKNCSMVFCDKHMPVRTGLLEKIYSEEVTKVDASPLYEAIFSKYTKKCHIYYKDIIITKSLVFFLSYIKNTLSVEDLVFCIKEFKISNCDIPQIINILFKMYPQEHYKIIIELIKYSNDSKYSYNIDSYNLIIYNMSLVLPFDENLNNNIYEIIKNAFIYNNKYVISILGNQYTYKMLCENDFLLFLLDNKLMDYYQLDILLPYIDTHKGEKIVQYVCKNFNGEKYQYIIDKLLLNKEINIDTIDEDDNSPLFYFVNNIDNCTDNKKYIKTVELFIKKNIDVKIIKKCILLLLYGNKINNKNSGLYINIIQMLADHINMDIYGK